MTSLGAWRPLEVVLQSLMSLFLIAMAIVTVIDVVGRYFLDSPLAGGYEIVQYLMALTVFSALPLTARSESHLTVSLLTDRLRGRLRHVHRICMLCVSAGALALIAWRTAAQANVLSRADASSGTLGLPLAPIAWIMTGLACLAVLVVLVLVVRAVLGLDDEPMAPGIAPGSPGERGTAIRESSPKGSSLE